MAVMVLAACDAPKVDPIVAPTDSVESPSAGAAAQYHYSPFIVQVSESNMVFDTITFKDVGLRRDKSDPSDPLLETIAEAVSYELQSTPELGVMQSSVEYVAEYTDPDNHRTCENDHLYVDVWNRETHWGYSLWSGCGESDNFAWEEIAVEPEVPASLPDQLAPVAGAIASKLVHAHAKKCFVKKC